MTALFPEIDTDPHPVFSIYSAGNFGEVAPQRLSPMSWSLVGDPMERATRRLVQRVWGTTQWCSGSNYVFVGYFGCRPYHNLSAYCHLTCEIPGMRTEDVTDAYFEGMAGPGPNPGLRSSLARRGAGIPRLIRELCAVRMQLALLEQDLALLEEHTWESLRTRSEAGLMDVLIRARDVLDRAWASHIVTTAGLVPLRAMQRKLNARLLDHAEEIGPWLGHPSELVWRRLHQSAALDADRGEGSFLHSAFYEVADSHKPWSTYAVRHSIPAVDTELRSVMVSPGDALLGMLARSRKLPVQSVARIVGETMGDREHSKSLVMRTLHVFRRALPLLSDLWDLEEGRWPYLMVGEMLQLHREPTLMEAAEPRRTACEEALAAPMPESFDSIHRALAASGRSPAPVPAAPARRSRGVAPGVASGTLIHADVEELPDGPCILVCESADADVAPLLPYVAGVLSVRGSELSHIAILCRELGLPVVVGFEPAMTIPVGTPLSIDGSTGKVHSAER